MKARPERWTLGPNLDRASSDSKAMDSGLVECLRCGCQRRLGSAPIRVRAARECPRCGYLGWAPASELSEAVRRALRDEPVELRHSRVA